jgi:phosphodiesterase/alkaline phosphatase D-like protein
VNRMLIKMGMAAAAGSLLISNATFSQVVTPAKRAAHVEIKQGPALESATDDLVIVRWTSNNPGGSDDHFGVVHYGTDPKQLNQTAKSHVRLNQEHPETIFRVRLDGLSPRTTYYYTVGSMEGDGKSDEVKSPVNHFTTPALGERIEYNPQPAQQPK